jgi:hypothetical protein
MFSAKATNATIEHNIDINWGKVDERLLHLVMHGTQRRNASFVATMITQQILRETKESRNSPSKGPTKHSKYSVSEREEQR